MTSLDTQSIVSPTTEGKLQIQLSESDHTVELRQANIVKNWTDRTTVSRDLPDFIAGMSRIGSFNLTGAPIAMAVKIDGTAVADPRDAVLTGKANTAETLQFIINRIIGMNVEGMRLGKSDEGLVRLYSQYREKIIAISRKGKAEKNLISNVGDDNATLSMIRELLTNLSMGKPLAT